MNVTPLSSFFYGCLTIFFLFCSEAEVLGQWKYEDEISLPGEVKKAFFSRYPEAQQVSWAFAEGRYVANFVHYSDYAADASFSSSGNWIKTHTRVDEFFLPEKVFNDVLNKYPNFSYFDLIIFIEKPGFSGYRVQFSNNNSNITLTYSEDGKLLN